VLLVLPHYRTFHPTNMLWKSSNYSCRTTVDLQSRNNLKDRPSYKLNWWHIICKILSLETGTRPQPKRLVTNHLGICRMACSIVDPSSTHYRNCIYIVWGSIGFECCSNILICSFHHTKAYRWDCTGKHPWKTHNNNNDDDDENNHDNNKIYSIWNALYCTILSKTTMQWRRNKRKNQPVSVVMYEISIGISIDNSWEHWHQQDHQSSRMAATRSETFLNNIDWLMKVTRTMTVTITIAMTLTRTWQNIEWQLQE